MLIPSVVSENIPRQKSTEEEEEETSFDCNGNRYRCSPNVPHLVSGVIIVYVIDNTALLQLE
jgi:hypothetical protein